MKNLKMFCLTLEPSHLDFINPPEDGDYSDFEIYEMCLERKGGE